jgi:hypothetical protein
MKRFGFSVTALCTALFVTAALAGCKSPHTTAPAEVSGLDAAAGIGWVVLSWSDPGDKDLAYIEIRFTPAAIGIAQPIKVNKGVQTKTISGLENGAAYTFTLKTVDTKGNQSVGISISPMPVVCQIELSQTAPYDFTGTDEHYIGNYTTSPLMVTVTNTGNRATGALTITLSGEDAASFTLSRQSISSVAVGAMASFTVGPKSNLGAAKTYNAVVNVKGGNGISAYFEARFTLLQGEYGISLSRTDWYDQTEEYDFSASGVFYNTGYTQPEALSITVTNVGKQPTGALTVTLTGTDADSFTLSRPDIPSVAVGANASFTVRPNAGLTTAKTYTAAVTVTGGNGMSAGFGVTFTLTQGGQSGQGGNDTQDSFGIAFIQTGPYDFSGAGGPYYSSGYTQPAALTLTVMNVGNQPTGLLHIDMTGADTDSFSLSRSSINNIVVDGEASFTIRPNAGLTAAKTYAATVTVTGSNGISAGFEVRFTLVQSVYHIALSQIDTYDFSAAGVYYTNGYTQPGALIVTITNTGNQPTGALTINLSGADADSFNLSRSSVNTIAAGQENSFIVQPKAGLTAAKTYIAAVAVTGGNSISAGFGVTFTLTQGGQSGNDTPDSFGIAFIQTGPYDFSGAGGPYYSNSYTQPAALTLTLVNVGNQPTGLLHIDMTGTDADSFILSRSSITDIAAGGNASVTVWPNAGLSAAKTYTAAVSVTGSNDISATFAVSFTVAAPLPLPAAPTGLLANAQSTGGIVLSWNAVTGAAAYKVYRADSSDGAYSEVITTTGTSYHDTGLSAGSRYFY